MCISLLFASDTSEAKTLIGGIAGCFDFPVIEQHRVVFGVLQIHFTIIGPRKSIAKLLVDIGLIQICFAKKQIVGYLHQIVRCHR